MIDSRTVACMLFTASLAGVAHANRPLNTDTADTIPVHRCQFEPYAAVTRSSGSPTEHAMVLQLNCGVTESTQLGVAASRASSSDESASAAMLGGKTTFVELSPGQTGIAVGYGLNAVKPSGGSWSADVGFIYLIASRQLTPSLLGHVNLGTSRSRLDRQSSTTWAAAFEWTATPGVVLSGETYGDDRSRPWVSTGLWWGVRDNFSVNMSLGAQTSNPRVKQVTAGFNVEF